MTNQINQVVLKMTIAQVVETSVAKNSPSQDSGQPNNFQSGMLLPGSNHFLISEVILPRNVRDTTKNN